MDIKKRVIELTTQMSEINYDSEEDNIIKDSITDIANYKHFETDDFEIDDTKSNLRNINADISLTGSLYEGKTVTRKKDDDFEFVNNLNLKSNRENELSGNETEDESSGNETEDMEEDESSGSDAANHSILEKKESKNEPQGIENYNIYSSGTRSVTEDIKKGIAIKNQLGLWESLLECRIKLQKSLVASNKLPQNKNFLQIKSLWTADNTTMVKKTNKSILNLLEKLLHLQNILLDQFTDYKLNKSKPNATLDKNVSDEEIPSSSDSNSDDEEEKGPARKKIKLHEYREVLKNKHEEYIPYRNMSIQKWNDKTKVASGKLANSNFSAFDQSTLKQIEQIMSDKERLINRTQIKRSKYRILGTTLAEEDTSKEETELNKEIFDDDDFYHKLLRDFIERRSVDGSTSTQSERQWMELQKLRSKMKKKVDTKSTKGRKIRYVVLPKLVNFMAPISNSTFNENAENELYSSLFGKITSR